MIATPAGRERPTVALLPWGNVLEDFLSTAEISLDDFLGDFVGSWMFGYVEALQRVEVRTAIVCVSRQVDRPGHEVHGATGAEIVLLPPTWAYRRLSPHVRNPYGRSVEQVFGEVPRPLRPALVPLRDALLFLPTPPVALARTLRRLGCDAILCQEYEYPRFDVCAAVGRLTRLPVFASFQGGDYQRSRLERVTRPIALRGARALIVPTAAEAERLRRVYGVDEGRVARIFNPVDTAVWRPGGREEARRRLGLSPEARVAAWHGRVSIAKKGLDVLASAWAAICRARPDADLRLLLVGAGHHTEELDRLLADPAIRGVHRVERFVHDRAELRDLLVAADAYAFPSRLEGFAVALVEAMACGVPPVAADASGVREILGADSAGTLVPRDDPDALARGLLELLDDPQAARERGAAARRRVETAFSLERVGAQLRELFFPA
ncbi:MAG TPA: glycosyltransferase family 4 protein [Gaiellaceae bacterium]|nr:glycosyltransferase family 4 protein [Gaiellaceae bacterium]